MGVGVEERGRLTAGPCQTGLSRDKGSEASLAGRPPPGCAGGGAAEPWSRIGEGPEGRAANPSNLLRSPTSRPRQLRASTGGDLSPSWAASAAGFFLLRIPPPLPLFLPPLTFLLI